MKRKRYTEEQIVYALNRLGAEPEWPSCAGRWA